MALRMVPKVWISEKRVHRTLDLGSVSYEDLFVKWSEGYNDCRYVVVLVNDEYWMIDIYTTHRGWTGGLRNVQVGDYWVFPTEEAAVMAANIIYGSEGLMGDG